MSPGGMKKIFISDFHLGDERSLTQPHPYGWIGSNISNLANFLEGQLKAADVSELVILGDLFDTWVIPTNMEPLTSFTSICKCDRNLSVIDALKRLAAKDILSYVPGNHDMAFSTADLALKKQFLETTFPGIHYICEPDLPIGIYRSGKLAAEHGNRFCLFNAPDTWTNQPSFLPLGYFISRLVAYKITTTGVDENYHVILRKFVQEYLKESNFIKGLFLAIKDDAKLEINDFVNTTGFQGFPPTVGDIGTFYESLIENWEQNRKDINWGPAAGYDGSEDLSQAAIDTYFPRFDTGQNIVIFGHTHKADLKTYPENGPLGQDIYINPDTPCSAIYANCGTWVDKVESTYVETQEDAVNRRHYVRLLNYPDNTPKKEAFVEL